jgi:hypothetical protein
MPLWFAISCGDTARSLVVAGLALAAGGAGALERLPVPVLPSGLEMRLQEIVLEEMPDGQFDYARFRFVAPGIIGDKAPDLEARAKDMEFLCNSYALPHLEINQGRYDRIVISLADRETELGVADPQATQFFEIFSVENGACIWGEI